ncbi:MAG: outer membrane lipoprotein-sorting protein [Deltaproteobacteria bacterium]|nr:outer membrane lipoprotein-sorting protein [Deltaproteobacteria bacterium]
MKILMTLLIAVLALTLWTLPGQALTARQIMEKVDARDDGDNMTAVQEMILIDKKGHERVRRIESFSKDKGDDTQKLMFFLSPAEVKGTGFLTYDYYSGDKDDDQWLYLPELKKVKRIAGSDKSSAFMGSDFSYADMTRRVTGEWEYKLLKEVEVRGHKCWLIEALPASETIRDRYGYTKSVIFVRQDIFMGVRAVNWVKEGNKIKYLDMIKVEQIDGIWLGTELTMKTTKNKQTLHKTVMKFFNVKFNQDLDQKLFTIRTLETGP